MATSPTTGGFEDERPVVIIDGSSGYEAREFFAILCCRSAEFLDFGGERIGGEFVGLRSVVEARYEIFGG